MLQLCCNLTVFYLLPYVTADPLSLLVDNALVASWVRQGLPSDPTSVQNGTILTNSERWPLMMDPQLQGVVWIKERESKNNLQVRTSRPKQKWHTASVCCILLHWWHHSCCLRQSVVISPACTICVAVMHNG
jgi:hypothetical protein